MGSSDITDQVSEMIRVRREAHPTLLRYAAGEIAPEEMRAFAIRYSVTVKGLPEPQPTPTRQLLIIVNEKTLFSVYDDQPHRFETARLAAEWILRECVGEEAAERGSYDFAREIERRTTWHLTAQQVRQWVGRQSFTS